MFDRKKEVEFRSRELIERMTEESKYAESILGESYVPDDDYGDLLAPMAAQALWTERRNSLFREEAPDNVVLFQRRDV